MGNPILESWLESQELPPIGEVDPPNANPILAAWEQEQQSPGRGRSILASLPVPGSMGTLAPFEEQMAALRTVFGGVVSGLMKPVAAFAGLPGAIGRGTNLLSDTEQILTDRVAATVLHWNTQQRDAWEESAIELGYSEQELRSARMLGEVVGFVAPGVATYKAAARLSGVQLGQGVTQLPFMAGLKVDVVSGLLWGGALTEGELPDRLKNALVDGGLSGAVGLALTGIWPAVAGFRQHRLATKVVDGLHEQEKRNILFSFYQNKRAGQIGPTDLVAPTAPEARGIFEMMSEESFLINSPAAQDILLRSANESALVQAIVDVAGAKASQGIVKQVGLTLPETVQMTDKFRAQFPTLKFQELKNPEGGFDVIFGTRVLNATQRAQYSVEGRFAGQRLQRADGTEYTYVGKDPNPEWIRVKRVDNEAETRIKVSGVADLPYGIEPELRTPLPTALFDDFEEFFRGRSAAVLNERYSLSDTDVVRLAREGRLSEEILSKRRLSEPNAITAPEEIAPGFNLQFVEAGKSAWRRTTGAGQEGFLPESPLNWDLLDDKGFAVGVLQGHVEGDALIVDWIETAVGPNELGNRATKNILQSAVAQLEAQGVRITKIAGERITGTRSATRSLAERWVEVPIPQRIRETGNENTWLLHPWEDISFEDAVRNWALERGLSTNGAEFVSLQTDLATQLKQKLRADFVRDFPQEQTILDAMQKEWDAILGAADLPLETQAAIKGFHLDRLDNGGVRLRDINTGVGFEFGSEQGVAAALAKTTRADRSFGEFGLPPDAMPVPISPSVVQAQPMEEIIADMLPDRALHEEMLDDIPTRIITNTRDLLLKYEDRTQIPLWRMGFSKIDEGAVRAQHEFTTWGRDMDTVWRKHGIKKRADAVRLSEYLVAAEQAGIKNGKRLTPTERYALAKEMGLSQTDFQAIKEFRRIMDAGFVEYGINSGDYIEDYFGRILPFVRQEGVVSSETFSKIFPNGLPEHLSHFAEFERTGVLANFEMDIRLVGHKWFKAAAMKRHVDEPYNFLTRAIKMEVRDLPKEQRIRLEKGAGRRLQEYEKVIPEPVGNIIKEYLNSIRGAPVSSVRGVQGFFSKVYKRLGIEVDPKITTEFFNTMLSTMYGAAMGARPMLLARNHMQTSWNLYTRLGGKHFAVSMEDAMSPAGFQHALDALAIRSPLGGVPLHDHIFEELVETGAKGTDTFSRATASAMNFGLSAGRVSRGLAEKSLLPYGAGDSFSRAWAFHYQRRHTADALQRFKQKKISYEKFLEEGLPFYDRAVREEFTQRLRYQSETNALDFIGKMSADETHFIYGMGNQPAWMQNPFGKFMGMFGTWPLWQKEVYSRVMRNGTAGQKMAAAARTSILIGATALVGHEIGSNMMNWMAPFFFTWTGGPGVDYAIAIKDAIDAPMDQKASALKRLAEQAPRLAVPGQVLMRDIGDAFGATEDPALRALYILVGRPTDAHFLDIEFENTPPAPMPRTPGAATSVELPAIAEVRDFEINLQSLGLSPTVAGVGSSNLRTVNQYEEVLQYLGGNVPR